MSQQPPKITTTGSLLALSVELAVTRACLLEPVAGQYRLASWLTVERNPELDLVQQLADTCRRLGGRLGRRLWDEARDEPLLQSEDALQFPPVDQVAVIASPRPHLRVWLAGLSVGVSLMAAHQALAAGPVQVVGTSCLTVELSSGQLANELIDAQPEVLVVVGGYDNADLAAQQPILLLCKLIGQAIARLPRAQQPALFYAGNRWAAAAAEMLLRNGDSALPLTVLGNLQPTPDFVNQAELAVAMGYHFWRLCERTAAFGQVRRWVTGPGQISNLETSFAQLTLAWMAHQGLPILHALYCTDAWWLHVWATEEQNGVRMRFVPPQTRPADLAAWPPLQLVSGEWPQRLWPVPALHWWDRSSVAPLVAAIGQVAPLAMVQALSLDVLMMGRKDQT